MEDDEWACLQCTFINGNEVSSCAVCGGSKPSALLSTAPTDDAFKPAFHAMLMVTTRLDEQAQVNYKVRMLRVSCVLRLILNAKPLINIKIVLLQECREAMEACTKFPDQPATSLFLKSHGVRAVGIVLDQASVAGENEANVAAAARHAIAYIAEAVRVRSWGMVQQLLDVVLDVSKQYYNPKVSISRACP